MLCNGMKIVDGLSSAMTMTPLRQSQPMKIFIRCLIGLTLAFKFGLIGNRQHRQNQ
jgi:hypothetical protein